MSTNQGATCCCRWRRCVIPATKGCRLRWGRYAWPDPGSSAIRT